MGVRQPVLDAIAFVAVLGHEHQQVARLVERQDRRVPLVRPIAEPCSARPTKARARAASGRPSGPGGATTRRNRGTLTERKLCAVSGWRSNSDRVSGKTCGRRDRAPIAAEPLRALRRGRVSERRAVFSFTERAVAASKRSTVPNGAKAVGSSGSGRRTTDVNASARLAGRIGAAGRAARRTAPRAGLPRRGGRDP